MTKLVWFGSLVLLVIGIADAAFKIFALSTLPDEHEIVLSPLVSFAVHRNPGIAFNLPMPLTLVLPITAIICAIFTYTAYKKRYDNPNLSLAALAAVTGAMGNGIDRLVNGFTTDYIILFRTSAINLSDVLILLGIIAVLWYDQRIPSRPVGD